MKYSHIIAAVSAVSIASLSACSAGTVRDTLGLGRSAPDEYRVVSRPPLSVPPEFSLRPPATSDTSPSQLPADQQAKSLVLGTRQGNTATAGSADTAVIPVTVSSAKGKPAGKAASGAESQFLKNAGTDKADPKVRDTLVEEKYTTLEQQEESHWWNPLSWGASASDKREPLVDAKKEAERIKKNDEEGKPVTTGDTPEVKDKDTGVLGRIFGY